MYPRLVLGRRRVVVRRALLATSTILAAGLIAPATAQKAPQSSTGQAAARSVSSAEPTASPEEAAPAEGSKNGGGTAANGPQPSGCDGCNDPGGDPPTSSQTGDVVPPKIYTLTPGGVNVAEGGVTYKAVDLSIGTLELERHYDGVPYDPNGPIGNGHDPEGMFFGSHTGHNFSIFVTPTWVKGNSTPGTVTYPAHWHAVVHLGSGSSGTYWQSGFTSSDYVLADDGEAEKGTLAFVNGAYTYTDQSGTVYQFNPNVHVGGTPPGAPVDFAHTQRVASITYPDGRVRTFSYDGGGLLKLVSDSSGYALVFDYSGGVISAACGFNTAHEYVTASSTCAGAALKASYGYGSYGLSSATDVLGQVTTYDFAPDNSGGLLTCIKPPGYATCKIANSYNGRTITQTMADGAVWHVTPSNTFNRNDESYVASDGEAETYVVDPAGKQSVYTFTGTTPYDATDANGHNTHYVFEGGSDIYELSNATVHMGSLLKEVELPEGNKYVASNNGPYHALLSQTLKAKPSTGLADQSISYGYDYNQTRASITKPTSRTDANGNTTSWSYTGFGMPTWEMQPAPTSGAARPLKLYTYVQKYAFVQNGAGGLTPSGGLIWMPASETQCQTAAGSSTPTCDGGAPQVTTAYEYGADYTADNLLVRGKVVSSGGVSLRTCYRYDGQGNKIAETAPRAGLASCPA